MLSRSHTPATVNRLAVLSSLTPNGLQDFPQKCHHPYHYRAGWCDILLSCQVRPTNIRAEIGGRSEPAQREAAAQRPSLGSLAFIDPRSSVGWTAIARRRAGPGRHWRG